MPEEPRQRVERAGGKARRARLTPAPGSDPAPEQPVDGTEPNPDAAPKRGRPNPDDDRITRERPPHW
jgi:hypothetical protein